MLSQAMGGGKTHSMIALGLLAKEPNLRKKILGDAEVEQIDVSNCPTPVRIIGKLGELLDC